MSCPSCGQAGVLPVYSTAGWVGYLCQGRVLMSDGKTGQQPCGTTFAGAPRAGRPS